MTTGRTQLLLIAASEVRRSEAVLAPLAAQNAHAGEDEYEQTSSTSPLLLHQVGLQRAVPLDRL